MPILMVMAMPMATGTTKALWVTSPNRPDDGTAKQARKAALVMVGTMVLWMGVQVVGGEMGWPVKLTYLFDLMALAGFIWSLAVTYQIWRKRRG